MKFLLIILFIAPSKPRELLRERDYLEYPTSKSGIFFDKKDADFDVALISRLRNFLDELENVISPEPQMRSKQVILEPNIESPETRIEDSPGNQKKTDKSNGIFTSFVKEINLILLDLNKDDLAKFVKILNSEMKQYFSPKAIIFHKIVFDPRLEAYIMNTLKEWKHRNPDLLKKDLKNIMKSGQKTAFGKFAETINFIFNKKDGRKLRKIIKRYYKGIYTNYDVLLTKMISDTLKFFLVYKYKTLNFLDRTVLSSAVTYLADYLSTFYYSKTIFKNSTLSLRKELNETIIKSEELYPKDGTIHAQRRSGFITLDLPSITERNSLENVLKDSSAEATIVKNDKEFEGKLPIHGVLQFDHDVNIKVKNVVRNRTSTTTTTTDFYDYKYGTVPRNYTILTMTRNTKRRHLGSVEENRRYFRRNFVHEGHDDEFLQAIEDNVKAKYDDYEFTDTSREAQAKRYNLPHSDKDDYYNLHYDEKSLILDKKVLESQENFFMGQDAVGPLEGRMPSMYRNF